MSRSIEAASLASGVDARTAEWQRRLAAFSLAWLLFEAIGGLGIYLLPFSTANQWMVVVHTLVGLLGLLPLLYEQVRHLRIYWSRPLTANKVMGYLASGATCVACLSGMVLTWQSLF